MSTDCKRLDLRCGRCKLGRMAHTTDAGFAERLEAIRARHDALADAVPADCWPRHLTRRERQVAALVAEGMTNKEIAYELLISLGTARAHVAHLMMHMKCRTRVDIAVAVTRASFRGQ